MNLRALVDSWCEALDFSLIECRGKSTGGQRLYHLRAYGAHNVRTGTPLFLCVSPRLREIADVLRKNAPYYISPRSFKNGPPGGLVPRRSLVRRRTS